MKAKRISLMLLALVMILGTSLAGCNTESGTPSSTGTPSSQADAGEGSQPTSAGDSQDDGEKVTLQMMVWNATETYVHQVEEIIMPRFPELDAKMDVEVIVGGSGDADVAQRFRLMLAAREKLPDMMRLNYTQLPEFAIAGVLTDLDPYLGDYRDDIIEQTFEIMSYDGTVYAYPQEVKPKIWYYRTDIFAEAGVDPNEVKTVDDLIEAARLVNEAFPGKYIENYATPTNPYDLMMMLSGNGGRFCDDEGNYNLASDENVRKAFEDLKRMNDSGYFAPIVEWSADWQAAFGEEILVSQMNGAWMKQHLIDWVPEQADLWDCALFPEEIRQGSEAGAGIWVIPADAGYVDLAAEFLGLYCFDQDVRKDIFIYNGIIPPLKSAKTDPVYLEKHPFFVDSLAPVYFEGLENLRVYDYTPASAQEIPIAVQYLTEYMNNTMSLDEALAQAEADMINQIGNPYQV